MRRLFAVLPLFLSVVSSSYAADRPIRFGISTFAAHSVNLPIIPATETLLENLLGEENIVFETLPVEILSERVKQGAFDMTLTSAGAFRRMAIEGAGVRDLATAASRRVPNPNFAEGSVFFVRNDSPIQTIEDLRGKSVAANHEKGFSGWQTALGELARRGLNPQHFFSRADFTNHDMAEVIRRVEDGRNDAGVVRTCFMEAMNLTLSRFRILGARDDGSIDCVHSTDLYPNWVIAAAPSLSPDLSRKIAAALFSMPPIGDDVRWSIATDFRGVDNLFRTLKIGPYEYLATFSFKRFIAHYWPGFAIALTLLIALVLHSVTVGTLVRRRTRELEASLKRENELSQETVAAQNRFLALQKVGIVGQMSSIIAHELRQPLAAISMQAFGLMRRFENGTVTRDAALTALDKISHQTDRAGAIVDQVRAYAKGDRRRAPLEINRTVSDAVAEARKSFRNLGVPMEFTPSPTPIYTTANPLEIELIVINLLKNAAEAVKMSGIASVVRCRITGFPGSPAIEIENQGRPFTDAEWDSLLADSLVTSKRKGLGLGLSIVRSLTDDLGGRLTFTRPASGGLIVTVTLSTLSTES